MKIELALDKFIRSTHYQFSGIEDTTLNKMPVEVFQYIPYEEWPKFINHPILGKLAQRMLENPNAIKQVQADFETFKIIKQSILNLIDEIKVHTNKANELINSFYMGPEDIGDSIVPSGTLTLSGTMVRHSTP